MVGLVIRTLMLLVSIFVIAFLSTSHAFSDVDAHCDVFMCTSDGQTYTFRWVVDETKQTLNATMQAPSNGENTWIAIGFSQGNSDPMQGGTATGHFADMVIGSYSSSSADAFVVRDYHTSSKTSPTLDDSQDVFINLEDSSYDAESQILTIAFWRPLSTGDIIDDKVLTLDTGDSANAITLIWGYNPYLDSITNNDGGQSLTKHDTTARGYSTGYTFTASSSAMTSCEACEPSSTSEYDERIAQCVSNGWPSVEEVAAFEGDVLTFAFAVTCSMCSTNQLTDQSIQLIADTLQDLLVEAVSGEVVNLDTTVSVGLTNATDIITSSGSPTVSFSATITSTLVGSGEDITPLIETSFTENDGAIIIDGLNSQVGEVTTITSVSLESPIAVTIFNDSPATCLSNDDGTWFATWAVSTSTNTINVTIQSTATGPDGWVAIGFHESSNFPVKNMGPGDFYIGSVENNGVNDYHLTSATSAQPEVDAQNDVLAEGNGCSYDETSGTLTCTFQRMLSTGDSDDVELSSGFNVGVLYAASDSQFPAYHTIYGSASSTIDMTTPCQSMVTSTPIRVLAIAHGVLMVIAWMLLLPWGAFVARFRHTLGMTSKTSTVPPTTKYQIDVDLKSATDHKSGDLQSESSGPDLWFRIHEPVQWVGVSLMFISLILIIIDAGWLTSAVRAASPTKGSHQIMGIIVATLAISQPIFALCRNGFDKKASSVQKSAAHGRWHIVHALAGITSLVLAFVALPLGVVELSGTGVNGFFIAGETVLLLALLFVSVLISTLHCKQRTRRAVTEGTLNSSDLKHMMTSSDSASSGASSGVGYWAYILLAVQILACSLSIVGVFTAGMLESGSGSATAPITDAVQGQYDLCNYMPGYAVTTAETQYYCQAFEFPDLDQQIINYKVLLDKAEVVHHMILYEAEEADPSEGFFKCDTMPPGSSPIYAWAPGNDEFTLPENVGFDTPKYAILQVHYNNPNGISGLIDRSGVLMQITDEIREYSAAFLIIGISLNKMEIPPEKENYGIRSVVSEIPSKMVGKNVFTSALHMHLIGKRIWTRLWRDGEVLIDPNTGLDALGYTDAYDYNFQHFDDRDIVFQEGDQVSTSCIFENTVQRGIDYGNPTAAQGLTVYGGESTQDEMCLSFVGYYPKTSASAFVDPEVVCDDNDESYMDCADYN